MWSRKTFDVSMTFQRLVHHLVKNNSCSNKWWIRESFKLLIEHAKFRTKTFLKQESVERAIDWMKDDLKSNRMEHNVTQYETIRDEMTMLIHIDPSWSQQQ